MAQLTAAENPFAVDPADELPVGLQLRLRLRALISTGRLGAGEALPSVRRLSDWAGVNTNTVRAVYAQLESDGLLVSRHGRGTFVADGVGAAPELERIATEGLREALDAGLSPRDLADVVLACATIPGALEVPEAQTGPAAADPEVLEVRAELRRQIGRLEGELAEYVRDLPGDLPSAPRFSAGHVAGVEELEATRDTLVAQLSEARAGAERRIRAEARARARSERAGEELRGPLARAMGWWDEKR